MNLANDLDEFVGQTLSARGELHKKLESPFRLQLERWVSNKCCSKGGRPTNAAREELWCAWEESCTRLGMVWDGLIM
jgi:hypothetical protein